MYFNAPAVGDLDGDGRATAVDGGLSEPNRCRRYSRTPPPGKPVTFSGGSRGYGHRAISTGDGEGIISTDWPHAGRVNDTTIGELEEAWGVHFEFWSTTIDGHRIPPY
jgi:hypothetical protein